MAPLRVKVCGITRPEDARVASVCGAWAVGFVFWQDSPRQVAPRRAAAIAAALPGDVLAVGVFVNAPAAEIVALADRVGLGAVQLHGDERAADIAALPAGLMVIKALAVRAAADVETALALPERVTVLLDAYDPRRRGGTGRAADWELAAAVAARRRTVLAGGLGADNVAEAAAAVRPWAVDASSRLETSPGIKDPRRVREFLAAAHGGVASADRLAPAAAGQAGSAWR